MTSHNLCPYGLKSLLECITRAALLSQPGDNPDFLFEYLSELINFRRCHPEDDPKIVSFNYQEMWENKFLGTKKASKTPITASAAAPQVPSQAQVEETLKELYLDLASSTDGNVKKPQKERMPTNKTSGKDKKPSASPMYPTPTPPPRVGRQHGKNVPPPFLVVKGERKPAPPPPRFQHEDT
ncbi:calcium-binding tyrosine phosphorylation-regulated protein-like [Thunnus thynnus]|uniref:calcium-binding tyrosine phosphorylation-regulated protein-like n=1 Tax=Thunnus thynnus TaxID=8237 RepID=UPI0035299384